MKNKYKKGILIKELSNLCKKFVSVYNSNNNCKLVDIVPSYDFDNLGKKEGFYNCKFLEISKKDLNELDINSIITCINYLKTFFRERSI